MDITNLVWCQPNVAQHQPCLDVGQVQRRGEQVQLKRSLTKSSFDVDTINKHHLQ